MFIRILAYSALGLILFWLLPDAVVEGRWAEAVRLVGALFVLIAAVEFYIRFRARDRAAGGVVRMTATDRAIRPQDPAQPADPTHR